MRQDKYSGIYMFRAAGTFGLGIIFVAISPALRNTLLDDATAVQHAIEVNSPFSYIGIGLAVLAGLMFALHQASQPRT
jgi:hypothetical protein